VQPSSIATAASLAVPDAGIDQHRHFGAFHDQADHHLVLDAQARTDRCAQRHDRHRAGFFNWRAAMGSSAQ
jgi:hypothetical protein